MTFMRWFAIPHMPTRPWAVVGSAECNGELSSIIRGHNDDLGKEKIIKKYIYDLIQKKKKK